MNDVLINKAETIERCMKRVHEEYTNSEEFTRNYTKQDSVVLNILRACEAALDMGSHVVRIKRLGVPQNSADVFTLLENANIITPELCKKMKAMVGFRNIAIHDYKRIELNIVKVIIEKNFKDITEFSSILLKS